MISQRININFALTMEVWKKFPLSSVVSGLCQISLRIPQLSINQIVSSVFGPFLPNEDCPLKEGDNYLNYLNVR
jgi:hypothetical protein